MYRQPIYRVRLFRDDLEFIWQRLASIGQGDVVARVESRRDGTAQLTEATDFAQLSPTKFRSVALESSGVTVVLSRKDALIRAAAPNNEQLGVISSIHRHVGQQTSAIMIFVYLGVVAWMSGGVLAS
jgi:hypothetical protein